MLEIVDTLQQSVLVFNEVMWAVCENKENCFVVSLAPRDIMIITNWTVQHVILDPEEGNGYKCFLQVLPGFNQDYVLASGYETTNLINVKRGTMQQLIKAPQWQSRGQQSGFFLQSILGFDYHFTRMYTDENNVRFNEYLVFSFRPDIIAFLQKC